MWAYAELVHTAHQYGGPELFIKAVEDHATSTAAPMIESRTILRMVPFTLTACAFCFALTFLAVRHHYVKQNELPKATSTLDNCEREISPQATCEKDSTNIEICPTIVEEN